MNFNMKNYLKSNHTAKLSEAIIILKKINCIHVLNYNKHDNKIRRQINQMQNMKIFILFIYFFVIILDIIF